MASSLSADKEKLIFFTIIKVLIALALILVCLKLFIIFRTEQTPAPTPTPGPTPILSPTPTPKTPPEQFTIVKGNVVFITDTGEIEILVDTDDFESESISRFAEVKISPDHKKICFLGHAPGKIWLFYANIDGSDITNIGSGQNCVWSHNSQKIAYNNHAIEVSPIDVYIYDTTTGINKNITKEADQEDFVRFYELPEWSTDDKKISSRFVAIEIPREETKIKGLSVIDLSSGEVTDFESLSPLWPY